MWCVQLCVPRIFGRGVWNWHPRGNFVTREQHSLLRVYICMWNGNPSTWYKMCHSLGAPVNVYVLNYFQEIGRCARDGLPGKSILYRPKYSMRSDMYSKVMLDILKITALPDTDVTTFIFIVTIISYTMFMTTWYTCMDQKHCDCRFVVYSSVELSRGLSILTISPQQCRF